MVFAEAMGCGLAVIGGDIGGVRDLIKKDNGILVEPGNVTELKKAILRMKGSVSLRINMSKANREKLEEHYIWQSVAEKYLKVY